MYKSRLTYRWICSEGKDDDDEEGEEDDHGHHREPSHCRIYICIYIGYMYVTVPRAPYASLLLFGQLQFTQEDEEICMYNLLLTMCKLYIMCMYGYGLISSTLYTYIHSYINERAREERSYSLFFSATPRLTPRIPPLSLSLACPYTSPVYYVTIFPNLRLLLLVDEYIYYVLCNYARCWRWPIN